MAGNTLDLEALISRDVMGCRIAQNWTEWVQARAAKVADWEEVRKYVYATDTSKTTNSSLPWKNKTTIPKLCQIRDNLYANYMAAMFPKRKWLMWEGSDKESEDKARKEAIQNYMEHVISYDGFKREVGKIVQDYIDYGNGFIKVEWEDQTQEVEGKKQVGYVGPVPRRISPLDIVFNPIASNFQKSPKIIRSIVSLGEVKEYLTRLSTDENKEKMDELWNYMKGIRSTMGSFAGDLNVKDTYFMVDGFDSYQSYLQSDYCELLTFYGDIYDSENDVFYRNHEIVVADRHKIIHLAPNPSYFGTAPIFHVGWRTRQDNLWAMGPLDNLVGLQYRLDHVENLKADVFDLITFPPLKVKGYVEDFEWGPMERIYTGDDGDVAFLTPPFQVLEANIEIENLVKQMEEMAGAPKEAMGFRTPGEKTAYEVQRMENAASRVFTNKISQFEEELIEPWLNAALELARRSASATSVRVFDDELKFAAFQTVSPEHLKANGKLRPVAARHFAERAELVQNINNFFSSPLGQDEEVKSHFSSLRLAEMMDDVLDLSDYELVTPYVRISERADAQKQAQAAQEQVMVEAQTPSGLNQDDYDPDAGMAGGPQGGLPPSAAPNPASLFGGG